MITLNPSSSASLLSSIKNPSLLQPLRSGNPRILDLQKELNQRRTKKRDFVCRADLGQDAPFALAVGACVLNSLVFPVVDSPDDDEDGGGSGIDSTDARFAVMGIISVIPYFNWLSWIFAWLDTGRQRYVVYSLVYLAPYIRTNLSLSVDESWLPIASVIACIIHIQLEASIRNGDIQGFQVFSNAKKNGSSLARKKHIHIESQHEVTKKVRKEQKRIPPAQEQSRDELRGWGVPQKPLDDPEQLNEDRNADRRRKD